MWRMVVAPRGSHLCGPHRSSHWSRPDTGPPCVTSGVMATCDVRPSRVFPLVELEPVRGLEPLTFRLQGGRSAELSYTGVTPLNMVEAGTVCHLRLSAYCRCDQCVSASHPGGMTVSRRMPRVLLGVRYRRLGQVFGVNTVSGSAPAGVVHATSTRPR